MNRTTRRVARKVHRCSRGCDPIQPGDVYLEHVCSPDHDDLGNTTWWRVAECAPCARQVGRGHLIDGTGTP